jgi:hypothetical protein
VNEFELRKRNTDAIPDSAPWTFDRFSANNSFAIRSEFRTSLPFSCLVCISEFYFSRFQIIADECRSMADISASNATDHLIKDMRPNVIGRHEARGGYARHAMIIPELKKGSESYPK